jgi:3-hydroxyacyl-CoA dehydrogenase
MTAIASPEQAEPVKLLPTAPVAVIEIDNPPVNATSHSVRAGLLEAIHDVDLNPQIEAVVIACAGRTFVAGADIREFGQPPREPHLPDVVNAIEACSKPVVAAIHGTALGGGCEIALASHARVAEPGASLGLPEVKLGLIPGAGGTQRLPRRLPLMRRSAPGCDRACTRTDRSAATPHRGATCGADGCRSCICKNRGDPQESERRRGAR